MTEPSRKILVVDDETSVLFTLVGNLEIEGFEVVEADSGMRALELIEQETFDLVLSDVRMPGMDGVTLLRRIRQRRPDLPVVLMTAFAVESALNEAVHAGVFTVVPKPLDVDHLVAVLAIAARRPVVLVVDDDRKLAGTTAEALNAAGVRARAVLGVDDVLEVVTGGGADICVIDLAAGSSGAELIERVRAADPGIACVAVSGPDTPAALARVAAAAHALLRHPVSNDALLKTIVEARRSPRGATS